MFLSLISEANVKMENQRLDCAGCSGSRVGPSRNSSEIKEIAPDIRTLSAHSLFHRKMLERVSQRHTFEALWGSYRCSGDAIGSPKAAKDAKKVDKIKVLHPEGPECYRRVPETSKMEPTWSQNGTKVITNIARETYVFNSPLAQIAHSGLLEGRATSCREAPPHNAYVLNYMYIGKVFCSRIRLKLNHVLLCL